MTAKSSIGADRRDGQAEEIAASGKSKKGPKSESEQQRLAKALRVNLSRRKTQERGRKSVAK